MSHSTPQSENNSPKPAHQPALLPATDGGAPLYSFPVKISGGMQESTLEKYRNQVLLIVNVASKCGYTKQYEGLEQLYQKFHSRGFSVLAFPCNQFGGQEPGSDAEIQTFCQTTFQTTFPLFSKIDVNGQDAAPLFEYLKNEERGLLGTKRIKWNFTKFLIDRNGRVIERFAPQVTPEELEQKIEVLLN